MDPTIIPRPRYLARLKDNMTNCHQVKVITGVRKSGKTTLLRQYREIVASTGATAILCEMQSHSMSDYLDSGSLIEYLYPQIPEDEPSFLFLDEVNDIKDWPKVVNSVMIDRRKCNVFITGSNSFMLSSEISTYLSGKNLDIHVMPFSFNEYLRRYGSEDVQYRFRTFLTKGAMPIADPFSSEDEYISTMDGIYNTIMVKDVLERSDKTISVFRLKRIISFVLESTGKRLAINRIATKTKLANDTVERYLQLLIDAFLIYPAGIYNIRGMEAIEAPAKYYVVDTGLRAAALDYRVTDMGQLLETAVFLELVRRGCRVYVGDIDGNEIDFVATKGDSKAYYQVCYTMASQETIDREVTPLRNIRDHFPKTIITADPLPQDFPDGVRVVNVVDWMRDDGVVREE